MDVTETALYFITNYYLRYTSMYMCVYACVILFIIYIYIYISLYVWALTRRIGSPARACAGICTEMHVAIDSRELPLETRTTRVTRDALYASRPTRRTKI